MIIDMEENGWCLIFSPETLTDYFRLSVRLLKLLFDIKYSSLSLILGFCLIIFFLVFFPCINWLNVVTSE